MSRLNANSKDEILIKALLDEVVKLPKDCEFNVFKLLRIDTKEVIMCRFLAELLKHDGIHSQGRVFFDLFFDIVLTKSQKPEKDSKVEILEEKSIESNRRIDIVIKYDDIIIPIEVKIHAGDQKDQCSDYVKYAKNAPLYYLTIEGDKPSNDSEYESVRDKVELVSWKTILKWLEVCIEKANETNTQFFDVLCQYAKAVESFIEKDDALIRIIKNRPEYEKAAGMISRAHHLFHEGNKDMGQDAVIEIIQSSPDYEEAANKISKAVIAPVLKAMPLERIDEKLRNEHGFKIYHSAKQHRTYHTDNEKVFLRLQYRDSDSFELVVCPIVDNGKFRFAGLGGRWNFEVISNRNDFDSLSDDVYLSDCVDRILAKFEEIQNGR